MIRRLGGLAACCLVTGALLPTAAAGAAPGAIDCDYTLSAPYVVDVAGTPMVTATLSPAACPSTIVTVLQACVSTPGKVGRCDNTSGNTSAQVYLAPYVPGLAYTARGRGCSAVAVPPTSICSSLGPTTAVL